MTFIQLSILFTLFSFFFKTSAKPFKLTALLHPCPFPNNNNLDKIPQQIFHIFEFTSSPDANLAGALIISDTKEDGYRLSFAAGVSKRATATTSDKLFFARSESVSNVTLVFPGGDGDDDDDDDDDNEVTHTAINHAINYAINSATTSLHDWSSLISSPRPELGGTIVKLDKSEAEIPFEAVIVYHDDVLVARGQVPEEIARGVRRGRFVVSGEDNLKNDNGIFCGVQSLTSSSVTHKNKNKNSPTTTLFEIIDVGTPQLTLVPAPNPNNPNPEPHNSLIFFSHNSNYDIYFQLYVNFLKLLLPSSEHPWKFYVDRCTMQDNDCEMYVPIHNTTTIAAINQHVNHRTVPLSFISRIHRSKSKSKSKSKTTRLILFHLNHEQPATTNTFDLQNNYPLISLLSDYSNFDQVFRQYYLPGGGSASSEVKYLPLGPAVRPVLHSGGPQTRPIKCSFIGNLNDTETNAFSPPSKISSRLQMNSTLFDECLIVSTPAGVGGLQIRDETMLNSAFCLAPEGNNFETFRFWEALSGGCCPVLVGGEEGRKFFDMHGIPTGVAVLADDWEGAKEIMNKIYFEEGEFGLEVMQKKGADLLAKLKLDL